MPRAIDYFTREALEYEMTATMTLTPMKFSWISG
jgi:hypothetical protein